MWGSVETVKKAINYLFLTKSYEENRARRAENIMKTVFSNVIFLNEFRVNLDGHEDWASRSVSDRHWLFTSKAMEV